MEKKREKGEMKNFQLDIEVLLLKYNFSLKNPIIP